MAAGTKNRFAVHQIGFVRQVMLFQNVVKGINTVTFGTVDLIRCWDGCFGRSDNLTRRIFHRNGSLLIWILYTVVVYGYNRDAFGTEISCFSLHGTLQTIPR